MKIDVEQNVFLSLIGNTVYPAFCKMRDFKSASGHTVYCYRELTSEVDIRRL